MDEHNKIQYFKRGRRAKRSADKVIQDNIEDMYNNGVSGESRKVGDYPGEMLMIDIPNYVKNLMNSHVVSRVQKYNPNDVSKVNKEIDKTKIVILDQDLSETYNQAHKQYVDGFTYSSDYPIVLLDQGPTSSTVLHELRHRLEDLINLSKNQKNLLKLAYNDIPEGEWQVVNTELRSKLLPYDILEQDIDAQNNYLRNLDNQKIFNELQNLTYDTQQYANKLQSTYGSVAMMPKNIFTNIINAMMYVPLYEESDFFKQLKKSITPDYYDNEEEDSRLFKSGGKSVKRKRLINRYYSGDKIMISTPNLFFNTLFNTNYGRFPVILNDNNQTEILLDNIIVTPNRELTEFFDQYFPDKSVREKLYEADQTIADNYAKQGIFITTNSVLQRLAQLHRASDVGKVYDWNRADQVLKQEHPDDDISSEAYQRMHDRMDDGRGRAFNHTSYSFMPSKTTVFIDPTRDKGGLKTLGDLLSEYSHPFNYNRLPDRFHIEGDDDLPEELYEQTYEKVYHDENATHDWNWGVQPVIDWYGHLGDVYGLVADDKNPHSFAEIKPEQIRDIILNSESHVLWPLLYQNEAMYKEAVRQLSKTPDGREALKRLNQYIEDRRKNEQHERK